MANNQLSLYQVAGMIRRIERKIDALIEHLGVEFKEKQKTPQKKTALDLYPTREEIEKEIPEKQNDKNQN
jgi:hypothetical protein